MSERRRRGLEGPGARGALLAAALALATLAFFLLPSDAAGVVRLTTPYPVVEVEPGGTTSFPLAVTGPGRQRVELEVSDVPPGFEASLGGGGLSVGAVFTDPQTPPELELEVEVPADAPTGSHGLTVLAAAEDGSVAELRLELRVREGARGGVVLSTEFPVLRGPSDATFSFDLELTNDTPSETRFTLQAAGPPGWQVEAKPSGETQASTLTVAAGESGSLVVEADPPDDTPAGTYPLRLRVAGDGRTAEAELAVEIVGNFALTITTPDERLNTDVRAGEETELALLVVNEGTAPLVDLRLSSTPPSGWEVEFEPEAIDVLEPQQVATVTARITPDGDAVAGDYLVNVTARTLEVSDSVELRTTVETSRVWGVVGLLLIAAAVVGLALVFRRYGRR